MIDGLRKGDIPTAKEMEAEARLNLTESVIKAYLESNGFVPGDPPLNATDGTIVRSSDDICNELASICDLDPNDVAEVLLKRGFKLTFPSSGLLGCKLGWVLCRSK